MAGRVALIDAADIRRLFGGLVTVLAERDPDRLHTSIEVAELYQQLIPYRTHRAALGFVSHQDYEASVLGLLAGVGGYARLEPPEAQDALAAEAASPNPDPSLYREFAGARLWLDDKRVREVLSGDAAYAPPPPPSAPSTEAEPPPAEPASPQRAAPVFELAGSGPGTAGAGRRAGAHACAACGTDLPDDRPVVFCPFCGTAVGAHQCPRCGDELRPEWRFCPRCGHARNA